MQQVNKLWSEILRSTETSVHAVMSINNIHHIPLERRATKVVTSDAKIRGKLPLCVYVHGCTQWFIRKCVHCTNEPGNGTSQRADSALAQHSWMKMSQGGAKDIANNLAWFPGNRWSLQVFFFQGVYRHIQWLTCIYIQRAKMDPYLGPELYHVPYL